MSVKHNLMKAIENGIYLPVEHKPLGSEELGLPWKRDRHCSGCIKTQDDWVVASTSSSTDTRLPDGGKRRNEEATLFILKAANHHHQLMEAVKRLIYVYDHDVDPDMAISEAKALLSIVQRS